MDTPDKDAALSREPADSVFYQLAVQPPFYRYLISRCEKVKMLAPRD